MLRYPSVSLCLDTRTEYGFYFIILTDITTFSANEYEAVLSTLTTHSGKQIFDGYYIKEFQCDHDLPMKYQW